MNIDDFRKLKNARHKLENVIQKNDFDAEIENELKEKLKTIKENNKRVSSKTGGLKFENKIDEKLY